MDVAGQAAGSPQELLEQAQTLTLQLNNPQGTSPEDLKLIQERLQQIQRLPQGWEVARGLLDHPDPNTKFFGALTFLVKINQSWSDLSEESTQQLKTHLISRFVALVDAHERQHVIRKLAAVLVAVFFNDESWAHPLRDIAAAFWSHGREAYSEVDFEGTVLPALNEAQITGLLSFSVTMAEEAVKNSSLVRKSGDHPVTESIGYAFCLCDYVLGILLSQVSTGGDIPNTKTGSDALESCHAWLKVRTSIYFRDHSQSDHIQGSVDRLIQCINIPTLSRNATDVLSDLLRNESRLLKQPHREYILNYIASSQGTELAQRLQGGDYDDEPMAFWELLEAYTSSIRVELVSGSLGPSHAVLLKYLDVLFQGPGYPGVDDIISIRLLEWWTETADDLQDGLENGLQEARQSLANAVLNVYRRLKWPAHEELVQWDSDDRGEFYNFRRYTEDFLLSVYPTLGTELIELFRQKAVSALEMRAWNEFESASFCLAQLSEAVDGNDDALVHLNAIFTLDRFTEICLNSDQLPTKTRQTLVDLLGKYQSYFERNPALLPQVLTFLFSSLNVAACTNTASRSIGFLSKSCRKSLVAELPVFLKICTEFQQSKAVTVQSLERVVEGIAAVVQALPSEEAKAPFIDELLKPFFSQSVSARDDAQRGDVESALSRGHLALRCIAGIGRGLRADMEQIIDLEIEETPSDDNSFWNGHPIQEQLSQCLLVFLGGFPLDHTVIEGICEVLKAGFTEKAGPFVLRPAVIAHFLTTLPLGTAGAADVMMSTASSFLASYQSSPGKVQEEVALLFIHVYWAFSLMMQNPESHDPEVSNSGIAFLTRSLPKYHDILFALTSAPQSSNTNTDAPVLQTILNFVSSALGGRETLPLRSAAQFWVGVLTLPNGTTTNGITNVSRAIHEYLPSLCHVLMTQLSGSCARSDISHLCEALKKIIFKFQGEARPHLTASLASLAGPDQQVTSASGLSKDKERFLAMLLGARGGSATQEIVRSYWVNCRGAGFAYT